MKSRFTDRKFGISSHGQGCKWENTISVNWKTSKTRTSTDGDNGDSDASHRKNFTLKPKWFVYSILSHYHSHRYQCPPVWCCRPLSDHQCGSHCSWNGINDICWLVSRQRAASDKFLKPGKFSSNRMIRLVISDRQDNDKNQLKWSSYNDARAIMISTINYHIRQIIR